MNTSTPTPRTDALLRKLNFKTYSKYGYKLSGRAAVAVSELADHARDLERELADTEHNWWADRRRLTEQATTIAQLRAALERLVAVHDMGGNEGPYANPDAVAHYLTEARAALVTP